jgi:hypothetical protein
MQFSPAFRHFLLGPNVLLSSLFSNTKVVREQGAMFYVLPIVWETRFRTHTKEGINYFCMWTKESYNMEEM